jgi:hypothetical protein
MQLPAKRTVMIGVVTGILAYASPGWSQYMGALSTNWNNPISAQISHYIQGNMQSAMLRSSLVGNLAGQQARLSKVGKSAKPGKPAKLPLRKAATNPVPKPAPAPKSTPPPPAKPVADPARAPAPGRGGSTSFLAIPARVLPAKFAQQFGKTPADQKRLEGLMHQVINNWETQALTRIGAARFNELWDLGKTIPYAVAVTQGVYRGNGAPPSREMIQATVRTLGEEVRQNAEIAKMTDLQKQELYETQAVMTFLLESGRQAAAQSRNLEGEKKIQEMAGKFLNAMTGLDPEKIEISNDGFVLLK